MSRPVFLSFVLLALTPMAFAQATTSTLAGTVTTEGNPLPGANVTVTSPSLLGSRATVTGPNGDYVLPALPPGTYSITFELEGMQTITRRAELSLAETGRSDANLKVSAVAESITVTATTPSILETPQISTHLEAGLIEDLAIGRRIQDRIQLAPGVVNSGTNGQTVIHGAQSFDNLYLVNGVVINENVRGQPQNAVIEDAIQETTLLTGGVSAEFGRFTGGVVSTITKSGGNEFSGSLRDNLTNDDWTEKTGFRDPVTGVPQADPLDRINPIYEATLGGRVLRDRLWFFAAGRGEKSSLSDQTVGTNIPYTVTRDQKRYEGKLTGQIANNHTLVVSYLDVTDPQQNTRFGNIVDLASLRDVENTIRLVSGHYAGVITRNLFAEGQYSKKDSTIIGGGSLFRDVIFGSVVRDISTGRRAWSPTFCGVCRDKERDNEDYLAKATFFLSTKRAGSHSLVAGYDEFHELRTEDNYQSGSDFRLFGDFIYAGQQVFLHLDPSPTSAGISRSRIQWDPLLGQSETSDFTTTSVFVNDKWDLNQRWSFNVGARFDKNDGKNQARVTTTDDSRFSPRLGTVYDVKGDGRLRFSASYGRYAAKIDQGPADSTATAGRYATYLFQYKGPEINAPGTPTSQLVPTEEVIRRAFQWFLSQGGASTSSPLIFSAIVPGLNQKIVEPLASPFMDELALGFGRRIGSSGFLRADLIRRSWSDFYVVRKDLSTGRTPDGLLDIGLIENGGDDFERIYNALQLQGDYKFLGRFRFGGNYTYSKLRGNVEGEEFNNGTVPVGVIQPGGNEVFETPHFPQYTDFPENRPVGYLSADVRHRANLWVQFDAPVPFGALSISFLERYHSGQNYSATGSINPQQGPLLPDGIANPGYAKPPSAVNYFFSDRGELRLDDISETNFNASYSFPVSRITFFVKADLINAFDEQGVEFSENPTGTAGSVIERRVWTRFNGAKLPSGKDAAAFNPFTTRPVEGVHYELDPNFGKPTNKDAYQLPRTYRIAVGLRF